MKPFIIGTIIALAFALASWGVWEIFDRHSIKTGRVVDRQYHAAYSTTHTQLIHVSDGVMIPVVHTTWHPERWSVTIEGMANSGKVKTRTVTVSENEYAAIELNSTYTP